MNTHTEETKFEGLRKFQVQLPRKALEIIKQRYGNAGARVLGNNNQIALNAYRNTQYNTHERYMTGWNDSFEEQDSVLWNIYQQNRNDPAQPWRTANRNFAIRRDVDSTNVVWNGERVPAGYYITRAQRQRLRTYIMNDWTPP